VTLSDEDDPTQEERIAKLRAELAKLGGSTISFESMPPDMEEEFLRHVLEYETTEAVTLYDQLKRSGPEVLSPDQLDDTTLTAALPILIQRLATLGVYLIHTNHLSDRQLYEYLYHEGLREEAVLYPDNSTYAYIIDLTGSGSDEDNQIYLKHYADEQYRNDWAHDWPDDPMPAHEDPPFDRDSSLPQSPLG
jgi:hypothetical protein